MPLGPIEAVRVFTTDLARARSFYAGALGLAVAHTDETLAIFETGQAKLIVEHIDHDDPEARDLVGRFAAFSFTVTSMSATLSELACQPIDWISRSERQPWGGIMSHLKDPDGNVITLIEYP